jgi:hypothetical protein
MDLKICTCCTRQVVRQLAAVTHADGSGRLQTVREPAIRASRLLVHSPNRVRFPLQHTVVGDEWFTQTAVTKTVQERHAYYFIADYHALTTIFDPKLLAFYTRSVTATWLACGLDLDVAMFYRRSDVRETYELT